jgi:GT2 family glycosyltransferase
VGYLNVSRLRRALVSGVQRTRSAASIARRYVLSGLADALRQPLQAGSLVPNGRAFERWIAANTPTATELRAMQEKIPAMAIQPVVSIVTPVYNTSPEWLRACIDSVRRQIYPNWQLCLCDDGSTSDATLQVLRDAAADRRICVTYLTSNEGISGASNMALAAACGEFIALCDSDDELTPDALYQVVSHLNAHPDADVIYSDEDKLDRDGSRCDHYFKPDWSPEHFLTAMYPCHLLVVRRSIVLEVGGFRTAFDGSQDFDLLLRVIQRTSRVQHVPHVLYHWRKVEGSVADSVMAKPWAFDAGTRAIADHLVQTNIGAEVEPHRSSSQYRIRHRLRGQPLVSIVMLGVGARRPITSADTAATLRCLTRLEESDYADVEVIVVEDGSMCSRDRAALHTNRGRPVTCFQTAGANLTTRVNFGVRESAGVHVVICCDLVEPRDAGWLQTMLEYSQQPAIGVVGAKLFYPDGRLRHVGVVLGLGGIAGLPFHGFPGSFPGYMASAIGVRNYSAVSGSCMMTRRAVFDELGGFRGIFGDYLTDIDYCLRVRRAGLRVVYTPYAELCYRGAVLGASIQARSDEAAQMQSAWGDVLSRDPYYNPNLTTEFFDSRPHVYTMSPNCAWLAP